MDANIVSGLFGAGGSILSGLFGQSSADSSMAFQKQVLQNRNQWAVADLKQAGLNPILAAGATSSGSAPGAQASMENPSHSAFQAMQIKKNMEIAERQQSNNDLVANATSDKFSAEAEEARAKAGTYPSVTQHNISSALQSDQSTAFMKAQEAKIRNEVDKLKSDLLTAQKDREHLIALIRQSNSSTARNNAETALTNKNSQIAGLRKKGEELINAGLQLDNELKNIKKTKGESTTSIYKEAKKLLDNTFSSDRTSIEQKFKKLFNGGYGAPIPKIQKRKAW